MTRYILAIVSSILMVSGGAAAPAPEVDYGDFMSRDRVGARAFTRKHPEWDGRGTVIAVLDTGVDMSVPGMRETCTGEVKVIEARDFTGQGIVHLRRPKVKSEGPEKVLAIGKGVLRGHDKLKLKPDADSMLLGFLEETRFKNSGVHDINENGRTSDRFGMLMARVTKDKKTDWYLWVDTDGDGHIDDEKPIQNYSRKQEYFFLKGNANSTRRPPMAFAATLIPKRREVELHFADGSHGTHVAGIASGYKMFGKRGFNGIAPGAKVMSLKIGDNTLSGGSTRSGSMLTALAYAAQWSKKHNVPVIANMSYGIGTETEGTSEIDGAVDRLLEKYPLLSVATSAGNSGPGLSTVGTPAGANFAFSTGALLTKENARNLYGSKILRDVIFYFSSRGGELGKPDGLAPGVAASTVPPWEWGVVMRGTSMASPQAAGCMSLVASAAVAEKVKFHGPMLARALRNSGRPVKGYSLLDQGSGLVNVDRAWKSLRTLSKNDGAHLVAGYQVLGMNPYLDDEEGPTAFFRTGTWFPGREDEMSFRIRPIYMRSSKDKEREKFFESFDLVSDADWMKPQKSSVFLRKIESVRVEVRLNPKALEEPGIHTGRIRGVYRGGGKGLENTAFELWTTVIVPYVFDLTRGYSRTFKDLKTDPGEVERFFIRVPEGATAMNVSLAPRRGRYAYTRLVLLDPRGAAFGTLSYMADSTDGTTGRARVCGERLVPGVWEIVANTHYAARETSHYELTVSFEGLKYEIPETIDYEMGTKPAGIMKLETLFDQHFVGRAEGRLTGYFKKETHEVAGDEIAIPFQVDGSIASVVFDLSMDPRTYGRFTDVAVNILDENDNAVEKGGFSLRKSQVTFENPHPGKNQTRTYTLQVIGAFAKKEKKPRPWFLVEERSVQTVEATSVDIWCGGFTYFHLYPNAPKTCDLELSRTPRQAPRGYIHDGEIWLRDGRGRGVVLKIPLRLRINQD